MKPPWKQTIKRRKNGPSRNRRRHRAPPRGNELLHEGIERREIHPASEPNQKSTGSKHLPGNGESCDQIADGQDQKREEESRLPAQGIRHLSGDGGADEEARHLYGGDGGGNPVFVAD